MGLEGLSQLLREGHVQVEGESLGPAGGVLLPHVQQHLHLHLGILRESPHLDDHAGLRGVALLLETVDQLLRDGLVDVDDVALDPPTALLHVQSRDMTDHSGVVEHDLFVLFLDALH